MRKHYFFILVILLCCSFDCFSQTCPPGVLLQNVNWKGWTLSFVRPCQTGSTTSAGRGGGIEIQNARFNGKLVFSKAHTPIINVKYENDACGPYRDWQDSEARLSCAPNGILDAAAGRCDGPATTICDTGGSSDCSQSSDPYCFYGVVVTKTPSELTLTTNLQAGWYRYVLKWHFFQDGRFYPEALFGATPSGCVTQPHYHGIYWRLDLDVEVNTNTVEERNAPKEQDYWAPWDPIFVESARMKQQDGSRWWRVRNTATGRAYLIYPSETYYGAPVGDEEVAFPILGDFWFLQYNSLNYEETDDLFGGATGYWAHLNRFIDNGASPGTFPGDVVIWYGAGTVHSDEVAAPSCHRIEGPQFMPDPKSTPW